MTSALRKAISTFTSRGTFHDEEKLQAVIKAAKDEERLSIYATMTHCPSCNGESVKPQIVAGHYICTNHEWHDLRGAIDAIIEKGPQKGPRPE